MDPLGSFSPSSAEVLTSRDSEQDFSTIFRGANSQSLVHSTELTALLSFQFVVYFYVLFLPPNKPNVLAMAFVFLLRFFSLFFVVIVKWNIIKKEKLNIAIFCRLLWM